MFMSLFIPKLALLIDIAITDCNVGRFGEHCSEECHCADGLPCDKDTGMCATPGCSDGWQGPTCNKSNYMFLTNVV